MTDTTTVSRQGAAPSAPLSTEEIKRRIEQMFAGRAVTRRRAG